MVLASFGLLIYSFAMLTSDELQPKYVGVILLVALQVALLFSRELRVPPASSERIGAVPYREGSTRVGQ